MRLLLRLVTLLLLLFNCPASVDAQLRCSDRYRKNTDSSISDPIIVRTCYLQGFRFRETAYPDYAGRYVHSDHAVWKLVKGRYVRSSNEDIFNARGAALLATINRCIRQEWQQNRADSNMRECLADVPQPPEYGMNDLDISFQDKEVWFSVSWGLPGACRAADGAIITFPLKEVMPYLK